MVAMWSRDSFTELDQALANNLYFFFPHTMIYMNTEIILSNWESKRYKLLSQEIRPSELYQGTTPFQSCILVMAFLIYTMYKGPLINLHPLGGKIPNVRLHNYVHNLVNFILQNIPNDVHINDVFVWRKITGNDDIVTT